MNLFEAMLAKCVLWVSIRILLLAYQVGVNPAFRCQQEVFLILPSDSGVT